MFVAVTLSAPALAPSTFAPLALAQRFTLILDGLCRAVAARMARPEKTPALPQVVPLLLLLWSRLRRAAARFDSLVTRAAASPLPQRPLSAPRPLRKLDPQDRLPSGEGWLIKLLPEANGHGSQLRHLLSDPEMQALLEAAPQAGRILRPLCRMLAIPPPPRGTPAIPPDQATPPHLQTQGSPPPVGAGRIPRTRQSAKVAGDGTDRLPGPTGANTS